MLATLPNHFVTSRNQWMQQSHPSHSPTFRSHKQQQSRPTTPYRYHILAPIDSLPQVLADLAAADEAPPWTLDQIAGLVFAGLLVALYFSSTQIDAIVARSQRRQLGLCEECGGLFDPASCQQKNCPSKDRR